MKFYPISEKRFVEILLAEKFEYDLSIELHLISFFFIGKKLKPLLENVIDTFNDNHVFFMYCPSNDYSKGLILTRIKSLG